LMADDETLQKVREAFDLMRREGRLGGWGLDDKFVSPFSQEVHATVLTISLLRGESERTGIDIDPVAVAQREGDVTVTGLADEIRRVLGERGIVSD
jgi:hypothetical protein